MVTDHSLWCVDCAGPLTSDTWWSVSVLHEAVASSGVIQPLQADAYLTYCESCATGLDLDHVIVPLRAGLQLRSPEPKRSFVPDACYLCESAIPAPMPYWAVDVGHETADGVAIRMLESRTLLVVCERCARLCDFPAVQVSPRAELASATSAPVRRTGAGVADALNERIEVELDLQWPRAPMRCPRCGNRGRGLGRFWERTWLQLRPDTARPYYVHTSLEDLVAECGRCELHGPLSTFLPPWIDPPSIRPGSGFLPRSAADDAIERRWVVFEATPNDPFGWHG